MPRKRKREPKPHKFINNIEHKYCSKCDPPQYKPLEKFHKDKQKWDGWCYYCIVCNNKHHVQRNGKAVEKRKRARDEAPTGFLVCLKPSCKKGLQPVDQFIGKHVRNDEPVKYCLTCRSKQKVSNVSKLRACQNVWDDWRKTHPCLVCNQNPNYKHNYLVIEADHLPEYKKVS